MDRDLLADLARQDILDAGQGSRLADIATLDKLISDVRQDLRDGDMDQLAAGRIDPLMDRIEDPGLRQAVFSELKALAAVDALQDVAADIRRQRPSVDIYFDLAALRGYHYHTGIVFAASVPGHGRALANGGRYDDVGRVFGRARPATGFATDLKALMTLLPDERPALKIWL